MQALRDWLVRTGTTQTALADRLGVKQPTVSNWIRGEHLPSAELLKDLVQETGISADTLLSEKAA